MDFAALKIFDAVPGGLPRLWVLSQRIVQQVRP